MRFLSSRFRTAAEVLLTVAVLAYVSYDLVDLGGSGKPTSSAATTTTASSSVGASSSSSSSALEPLSASPALPAHLVASAAPVHFETQVDPRILPNNTIPVCNVFNAPTNPFNLGGIIFNQSMIFQASTVCTLPPSVLPPNGTSGCAALQVASGSWISLQNLATPALPGCVGLLTMDPGSYLEAVIPAGFAANAYVVQNFPLLVTSGACPSLAAVNPSVVNCPIDTTLSLTGPYGCALYATPAGNTCVIGVAVAGALKSQATTNIQATMNKDCSTMTQATFMALIAAAIGVSPAAILITYWQCSSIVVIFTVLGATPAQATAVLNMIYASMQSGQLRTTLAITAVILNPAPFPTAVTVTSTYAKPYYPMIPYPILVSSSNPALFALLSLLLIPIAVVIALLVWWCYRNRVVPPPECPCVPQPCCPPPMPMCCPPPMPAPVCCEPVCCAPTAMCCDPLITPSSTPFTATPGLYQPTL